MSKASNIQKMIDYLVTQKRATREELASYLNVNKKTISSYVNDINADYHYYIKAVTGKYGGYELTHYNTSIQFDKSELNALLIAKEVIEKTRPEISPELNFLVRKIKKIYEKQNQIERPLPNDFYKSADGLSVHRSEDRKIEDRLNRAIASKMMIQFTYGDVYKKKSIRKIDPYEVLSYKGSTYLIGLCHLRGAIRIFKLSRITCLVYTTDYFEDKKTYNRAELLSQNIGIHIGELVDAQIRIFAPFDVIVSEKQWIGHQVITRESEDSVIFEGLLSNDAETITWLLSMKECVEIIEPESLVEHYKKTVEKIYK